MGTIHLRTKGTVNSANYASNSMALESDDSDIRPASMYMILGGNGDYYITIKTPDEKDPKFQRIAGMRIATSGGNAPSEVKIAVAELFRAMEKHGLNQIE